ncbi:TPA: phage tail fiber C-terminal domain-containing protein, partial [Salmonella enterica]|nr:phage tail fiber C-terminal domain-containing protein [Salmonella enterica]
MTIFKKIKHCLSGGDKSVELRLGPAEILVSDDNGVIPEQGGRILTQVIILDAPKGQIECVYRP